MKKTRKKRIDHELVLKRLTETNLSVSEIAYLSGGSVRSIYLIAELYGIDMEIRGRLIRNLNKAVKRKEAIRISLEEIEKEIENWRDELSSNIEKHSEDSSICEICGTMCG